MHSILQPSIKIKIVKYKIFEGNDRIHYQTQSSNLHMDERESEKFCKTFSASGQSLSLSKTFCSKITS